MEKDNKNPIIDPLYVYPQVLARQLVNKAPGGSNWEPTDISAAFNSDNDTSEPLPKGVSEFWFKELKVPMVGNQFDLEITILHELMHGLGFITRYEYTYPNQ